MNTVKLGFLFDFCSAGGRNLNIIAMALSGFTDDKNSLWREMCAQLSADLSHPYLRAMFDFLTTDSEHYTEILVSSVE